MGMNMSTHPSGLLLVAHLVVATHVSHAPVHDMHYGANNTDTSIPGFRAVWRLMPRAQQARVCLQLTPVLLLRVPV